MQRDGLLTSAIMLAVAKASLTALAPLLLMSAPAVAAAAEPTMPQPAAILSATRRVADWQLANRNNWAAMPAARKSVQNPRDWQQATFWVALTELARRDRRYAAPLLELGRDQGWRLGDRPFHADDQLIAQAWIWAARHGAGKAAMGPARGYFIGSHVQINRVVDGIDPYAIAILEERDETAILSFRSDMAHDKTMCST